jgi:hypothetical protein
MLTVEPQRRFPEIEARGLDGRSYRLPGDLGSERNVLLVAFHRSQQEVVDGWLPPLLELERRLPDLSVYELPTISRPWAPLRRFIDGGMTRGIPDPAARARTLTAYTDVQRVLDALGLTGTQKVAAALVERDGRISWQGGGDFDQGQLSALSAALDA